MFFALVNACRHLEIDPESSVRAANHRFQRRFESIERAVGESGRCWSDFRLEELEALWVAAKVAEG